MLREARELNFEKAASLRDRLEDLRIELAVEREGRDAQIAPAEEKRVSDRRCVPSRRCVDR